MKQKEYCKPDAVWIDIQTEQALFNMSFTNPDQLDDFGHQQESWDD